MAYVYRAIVYIGHGYAEHTGRFAEFAEKLTEIGMLVVGHDNSEIRIY